MTVRPCVTPRCFAERFAAASCAMLALAVSARCADFTVVPDPAAGLPNVVVAHPSFQANIQPMFTARCAQGGCHTTASAQARLVLTPGHSYYALVNRPAYLAAFIRVRPGDHVNSWLWRMIAADSSVRFGLERMPFEEEPLTPNQIQTIVNWIDEGAPSN